jgi:uncharacterized protein YybS (DUF2232 family)
MKSNDVLLVISIILAVAGLTAIFTLTLKGDKYTNVFAIIYIILGSLLTAIGYVYLFDATVRDSS